jgi:hypothetical protein
MSTRSLLVFIGPHHHIAILRPVYTALERRGWNSHLYTANAEASFETDLANVFGYAPEVKWDWLPNYQDREKLRTTYAEGSAYLRELYQKPDCPINLLLPPIADRIVYDIATDLWATQNLIEQVKPAACLALHELSRWGMLLGYGAARKGIPYFTQQEGCYYAPFGIYTGHCKYSTSLVWGEATKVKLLEAGCDPNKIKVVGHPGLKARWDAAEGRKQDALDSLPQSFRDKRLAMLYVTNLTLQAVDTATLVKGMAENNLRLIVQIAILAGNPLVKKVQEVFSPHPDLVHISPRLDLLWPQLCCCEALCILGTSTLALEALWKGIPVAACNEPPHLFSFLKAKVVADANRHLSVVDWVTAAKEMNTWKDYQQQREGFLAHYIAHPDAAEAMADLIEEACG